MAADVQRLPPSSFLLDLSSKPTYNFSFTPFLAAEHAFSPTSSTSSANPPPPPQHHNHQHHHHAPLICKHWLRGLCKKGTFCDFSHSYNLRAMPECNRYTQLGLGICPIGEECLFSHTPLSFKTPPCPHYDRGFCPLGPWCAKRHVKREKLCALYVAGFCPDARRTANGLGGTGQRAFDVGCERGSHAKWVEDVEMKRPEVRVLKSREEEEREMVEKEEAVERELEREAMRFRDGGGQGGRDGGGGRDGQRQGGPGMGKGQGRRGRKSNFRQRRNDWS